MNRNSVNKGYEFEVKIENFLNKHGFVAHRTNKTNPNDIEGYKHGFDGGVDIIARYTDNIKPNKDYTFFIQCKYQKHDLTKSAIAQVYAGMHARKDLAGIHVPIVITNANVSKETIQYARDLNVELFLESDVKLLKQAKVTKSIPYGNYGILLKVLAYQCLKDRVWIDTLPDNKNALSDISITEKLLEDAKCDFNNIQSYIDTLDDYNSKEKIQKIVDACKVAVFRTIQFNNLTDKKEEMLKTDMDAEKYKKVLLQFLSKHLTLREHLQGIENMTLDELIVIMERVLFEIKKQEKDTNALKELIEKHIPVKVGSGKYEPKSQSTIKCCLHCGSVSIKKHGKTTGGVQRYQCKDCGKTFTENYGLITHYSHLADWQWREIIRGTVEGLSLTDISKNIGTSVSTVWSCRMKIYQSLFNIYGYCDTFNNIVEADGKYERISFKGKKDKNFFIEKLGRLPRHHRSKSERHEYLDKAGKYEELFKTKPTLLREMVFGNQKRMLGRATIDTNHQHVCILTAVDRTGNIYIEPVTAGTAKSHDIYNKFNGKVTNDAVFVTDDHHSYKYFTRKEQIKHVRIEKDKYTNSAFSLSRVNSLHSAMDRFFKSKEYKPATKYLDLYLMMFWWLQKNKDLNGTLKCDKLFDTMTGKVSTSERAKMTRVTIKSLVSKELPIDTKDFYPKCA